VEEPRGRGLRDLPLAGVRRRLRAALLRFLRAIDGNGETVKTVKAWILDEYRKVEAAA